jgi:UDP-3-O-[3-hydroxymyristoyl] N-acetylglucosamine deacetylase/3-hydroxyacyl-[acyl-carrier-protein] dehydratase
LSQQRTIKQPAEVQAPGLFSGEPSRVRFLPAGVDAGVVWVRELSPPVEIETDISNLAKRARRTSLMNGRASVETVEHVLSALAGLGIDNVRIEASAEETPSTDGSPMPFVEALEEAGIAEQDAPKRVHVIDEPVSVQDGDSMIAALPGPSDYLDIVYELDYSQAAESVGRQVCHFRLGKDDYVKELAPARTFLLKHEADAFLAKGMGQHLTPKDLLVMDDQGPVENELRFPDEHVRHKICDVIGDLRLLGRDLRGRIVVYRGGHELHHALVRRLSDMISAKKQAEALTGEPVMDIRRIMRLLPHRYPFLMVDRILEVQGDQRALGIKNVTINEPFFQGHYPNMPIMPGVMILEALAQLSGILLSRRLEHTGKVAVLLSMDRVKMRRPVRPGDQLLLQAEALHVRTRTGHCRCKALVGNDIAAEAEIKFMLVDSEPV